MKATVKKEVIEKVTGVTLELTLEEALVLQRDVGYQVSQNSLMGAGFSAEGSFAIQRIYHSLVDVDFKA